MLFSRKKKCNYNDLHCFMPWIFEGTQINFQDNKNANKKIKRDNFMLRRYRKYGLNFMAVIQFSNSTVKNRRQNFFSCSFKTKGKWYRLLNNFMLNYSIWKSNVGGDVFKYEGIYRHTHSSPPPLLLDTHLDFVYSW